MGKRKITPPPSARRAVAYVDETFHVEGRGYRVAFVFEGESGYRLTGDWPYSGAPGEVMPWFWGNTIEEARSACDSYNAQQGIDRREAFSIIGRSMAMGATRG